MIWIIIEMSFPSLLIILPISLYRSNRLFMAKFTSEWRVARVQGNSMCSVRLSSSCYITMSMQADTSESGEFWYPPYLVPFCSRSDVPTGGCTDSTRIRKGSLWQPWSHWSSAAHHGVHARLSSFGRHVLSLLPCVSRMAG